MRCTNCGAELAPEERFCGECGAPRPSLPSRFEAAAQQFAALKARYDAKELSEAEYEAALERLVIQDEAGTHWMIGAETGQWYRYDGHRWVRAEPPIEAVKPARVGPAAVAPQAQPTIVGLSWQWIAMACGVLLIIVVIVAGALAFPRLLSLVSMPIEPTGIARAARTATPVLPTRVPAVIVVTATPPPGAPTEPPPPPQTQPPPPPQTQPAPPPTQPSPLPPTEPLLPTRTLVPASPTPTVVLASFGCPGASGNSLFFDDFGNPESGWTVYRGADYEHFYEDGEFHFNVFRTNTLGHSWMLLKDLGTRYRIEVQGRKLGGPNMNDYGLLFGGQSDITYDAFLISDTGSYQVFKKVEGQRYDLATWTKTPFVNQGGLNFLGVKVEGTQFTVCLNGQVLTTMNDPALKSGRVGMIAGAFDEPVHIHFDNFGVWKLD